MPESEDKPRSWMFYIYGVLAVIAVATLWSKNIILPSAVDQAMNGIWTLTLGNPYGTAVVLLLMTPVCWRLWKKLDDNKAPAVEAATQEEI